MKRTMRIGWAKGTAVGLALATGVLVAQPAIGAPTLVTTTVVCPPIGHSSRPDASGWTEQVMAPPNHTPVVASINGQTLTCTTTVKVPDGSPNAGKSLICTEQGRTMLSGPSVTFAVATQPMGKQKLPGRGQRLLVYMHRDRDALTIGRRVELGRYRP
jgi:hypothetical protein